MQCLHRIGSKGSAGYGGVLQAPFYKKVKESFSQRKKAARKDCFLYGKTPDLSHADTR